MSEVEAAEREARAQQQRAGNRRRNKEWAARNPEHVRGLNRAKAMRSYYKNHEQNKEAMRVRAKNRWTAMTPEERRARKLRAYGLTLAQWDELFTSQGNCCAACGATEPGSKIGWTTDHCHETGKVRGILCHCCNAGLGHAKDDPVVLRRWIDYLTKNT